jgi:tetratricopeptide (TPR) repeat protein
VDEVTAQSLLGLAEELAPGLRGLDRVETFARLEEEYDELVAALTLFAEERRADEALRLTRALGPFWQATRRLDVATEWFDRALSLEGGGEELRGRALLEAGFLWFLRGDDERATTLYREAQELGARLEAPTVSSLALAAFARIELRKGDLNEARRLSLEAHRLSDSRDDPIGRGSAAHVLGVTAQMHGDFEEARRWMTERIELARREGNFAGLGLEESNLAMVERQLGNLDRADELLRDAIDVFWRRRDEWAIPFGLNGLAAVAAERGDLDRAARLLGAADALVEAQSATWPPDEQEHYDRTLARLEEGMPPDELRRARDAGGTLGTPEMVALARG